MSGLLKTLKKVFISPISAVIGGKAGKIIRKVAIGALMVGAVVMTGGAALGVLPSMGAMVGSLGLSAGLTTALTGAISTGAVGAVGGFLQGGFKGATKGFLMGAATGGVMGGLGMLGPNGLIGGGKALAGGIAPGGSGLSSVGPSFANATLAAPTTAPALGLAAPGMASGGIGAGLSSVGPSFAGAAAPVASAAAPLASAMPNVAASGGGIGGFLGNNPMTTMMLGNALTGAFTPSASSEAAKAEAKQGATLFSGAYTNNNGFGTPGSYSVPSNLKASQPTKRFRLNRQTMEVEEVPG